MPSASTLPLLVLTVQRASVSFCAALAGSSGQISVALLPALIAAFSSSLLCCRGAATKLASTICPDIGQIAGILAAAHDGARLREGLIDPTNTACDVWADTAYRSQANEGFLADRGKRSRIHRKKPAGKPMPKRTARANAKKSKVRATIEHVFAQQKARS